MRRFLFLLITLGAVFLQGLIAFNLFRKSGEVNPLVGGLFTAGALLGLWLFAGIFDAKIRLKKRLHTVYGLDLALLFGGTFFIAVRYPWGPLIIGPAVIVLVGYLAVWLVSALLCPRS